MWQLTVWIIYGNLPDIFFDVLYLVVDAAIHGDSRGNGGEKRFDCITNLEKYKKKRDSHYIVKAL